MNDYEGYLDILGDDPDDREFSQKRLAKYSWHAGVPHVYQFRSINKLAPLTPAQADVICACVEFLDAIDHGDGEHRALWLIGPPGTGKTQIAAAMITTLYLDRYFDVLMTTPAKLVRRLRSTWSRDSKESEAQVIEELAELDLLVIDDIGAGWGSDAEAIHLGEVIDERYSRALPTVITSNLDVDGLRAELGDRTFDRLKHGARVLVLEGESLRRPAQVAEVVPITSRKPKPTARKGAS